MHKANKAELEAREAWQTVLFHLGWRTWAKFFGFHAIWVVASIIFWLVCGGPIAYWLVQLVVLHTSGAATFMDYLYLGSALVATAASVNIVVSFLEGDRLAAWVIHGYRSPFTFVKEVEEGSANEASPSLATDDR